MSDRQKPTKSEQEKEIKNSHYKIQRSTDGKTLWVNGLFNCLGRFSDKGYEVYRAMSERTDVIGSTNTLAVRIHENKPFDWNNFKALMKEHHKIDLDSEKSPLD